MSGLRISLLGAPLLECEGEPLKLDTRKNLALVAYLAVTGVTQTREALVTLAPLKWWYWKDVVLEPH